MAGHVGGLGQLEGQAAELGGRPADLRHAALALLGRLEEARLALAVGDGRGLMGGQHAGVVRAVVAGASACLVRAADRSPTAQPAAGIAEGLG